jgi:hypothetical protein
MDITPIHRRVVGLDVHQNKITACALSEQPDGSVTVEHREFGASSAIAGRWRSGSAGWTPRSW